MHQQISRTAVSAGGCDGEQQGGQCGGANHARLHQLSGDRLNSAGKHNLRATEARGSADGEIFQYVLNGTSHVLHQCSHFDP